MNTNLVVRLLKLATVLLLTHPISAKELPVDISASVDIVGSTAIDEDTPNEDRIDIREAEVLFSSPIDPYFDGTLSLAAHREKGVSLFEVHEAYISSSKIIPFSRFKIGQFFLGIGRLNQTHRHEWPFIYAPKVQKEFFGEEAASDTGGEYSVILPAPIFIEFTLGATNGFLFGHAHNEGTKPPRPLVYNRLSIYHSIAYNGGVLWNLSYLNHLEASKNKNIFVGADLTAKWRDGKKLNFLLQAELWKKTTSNFSGSTEEKLGTYIFPQFAILDNLYFGCRLDYFTHQSLKNIENQKIENAEVSMVPTITLQASEFSKFRVAYEHTQLHISKKLEQSSNSIAFQANFILGAHPSHDF